MLCNFLTIIPCVTYHRTSDSWKWHCRSESLSVARKRSSVIAPCINTSSILMFICIICISRSKTKSPFGEMSDLLLKSGLGLMLFVWPIGSDLFLELIIGSSRRFVLTAGVSVSIARFAGVHYIESCSIVLIKGSLSKSLSTSKLRVLPSREGFLSQLLFKMTVCTCLQCIKNGI